VRTKNALGTGLDEQETPKKPGGWLILYPFLTYEEGASLLLGRAVGTCRSTRKEVRFSRVVEQKAMIRGQRYSNP
jgi:hypothetical protein